MPRATWTLTAIVVAIAAAIGWWYLRADPGAPVPAPVSAPGAPVAADPEAPRPEPRLASADDAVSPAVLARDALPSADTNPIPDDAEWIEVRVLDATTKAPVAGADVSWSTASSYTRSIKLRPAERQGYLTDIERIAKRFGWATRTNEQGIARVTLDGPDGHARATVHAYAGGGYGTVDIRASRTPPAEGWTIELARDLTLRAVVVDAQGLPAPGVRVVIKIADAAGATRQYFGVIAPVESRAGDGIAEFRHCQRWEQLLGRGGSTEAWTLRVATQIPGTDDPGIAFDFKSPPAEPLRLEIPATGQLTARLRHRGVPMVDDVTFSIIEGVDEDYSKRNHAERVFVDDEGWAHFPRVGLGGTLTVIAHRGTTISEQVAGPSTPDHHVRVEFTTDDVYSLSGTLLDPDGLPLADTQATARIQSSLISGGAGVATDSSGAFVWLLDQGARDNATIRELVFEVKRRDSPSLRTTVAKRDLALGVNDLGVLQLSAGQLVVGGRFATEDPDPVAPPSFSIQTARPSAAGDTVRWVPAEGLTSALDRDGTFEVRGDGVEAGRYRMVFRGGRHLPLAPVEFDLGRSDLVVEFQAGHSLEASCVLPPQLTARFVQGVLVPTAGAAASLAEDAPQPFTTRPLPTREDGPSQLHWYGLPAGTYTLQIRSFGVQAPFATVPGVVVPPPQPGDPRLQAIDLRDATREITLRVELATGEALSRHIVVACCLPQPDGEEWEGIDIREPESTLTAPRGPVEFLVACRGFQPQTVRCDDLPGVEGSATVQLQPWPEATLAFDDLPELPEGTAIYAIATPTAATDVRDLQVRTAMGGFRLTRLLEVPRKGFAVVDGRARLPVGPGEYRVSAHLQRGRTSVALPVSFTLRGPADGAPIPVALSAAELRAALAELDQ